MVCIQDRLFLNDEAMMVKKSFNVPDMHCVNCSMRLESIEDELAGIKEINTSYHKQQMTGEFDETKVDDDQIITAVKKKGYQAVIV
jgi:copper chaperone CopZ